MTRVANLDLAVLQEQLAAVAARIIAFTRHSRGYQGAIEVEDVEVVVRVRCADGRVRRIDPAEITETQPRAFVRDFVTLGDRPGINVVQLLERFLPIVSPKAAGWLSALKGLWPK